MAELAIEARGVRKTFGDTVAVAGLDLAVPWGQICGYLGPNGAGKTTTLRLLAGVDHASAGSVAIAGHDLASDGLAARAALGFVPDSGALYGLLTVSEHLALVADLHDLDAGAGARAEALLAEFGAADLLGRRIDTLSKGQRQKAALVAAFLPQPRVLLLDEPLSGLDVHAVTALRERLRAHADGGGAVLYSSHILDVVERLCDRTVILAGGAVVADGPTAELLARSGEPTLEAVFRSLTRADAVEGLGEALQ